MYNLISIYLSQVQVPLRTYLKRFSHNKNMTRLQTWVYILPTYYKLVIKFVIYRVVKNIYKFQLTVQIYSNKYAWDAEKNQVYNFTQTFSSLCSSLTTWSLFNSVLTIYEYNFIVDEANWRKKHGDWNANNRLYSQNQIMYSICVRITMFNLENILNLNYDCSFFPFFFIGMTLAFSGYQNKSFMQQCLRQWTFSHQ